MVTTSFGVMTVSGLSSNISYGRPQISCGHPHILCGRPHILYGHHQRQGTATLSVIPGSFRPSLNPQKRNEPPIGISPNCLQASQFLHNGILLKKGQLSLSGKTLGGELHWRVKQNNNKKGNQKATVTATASIPIDSVVKNVTDPSLLEQTAKIEVVGLSRYGIKGEMLLEGVNMCIRRRQLVALIGPSGSGKSTVLRAMNRMWEPLPGTVFLDGYDVTQLNVVKLRTRIGMVFQNPSLFDGTVAYNVQYGPSLRGHHLSSDEVDYLLIRAGIDPGGGFQNKISSELSGGEAQRVSIARALANSPEVLLLDEPTSSLDPTSTRKVEETILHLREEGMTVVLVSHSMDQVVRMADTAVLLTRGRVLEMGSPEELKRSRNPEVSLFFTGELQ